MKLSGRLDRPSPRRGEADHDRPQPSNQRFLSAWGTMLRANETGTLSCFTGSGLCGRWLNRGHGQYHLR
jgi:hypothetical protein